MLARIRRLYPLSWFLRLRWLFRLGFAARLLAWLSLDGQLGGCGVSGRRGGGVGSRCAWGMTENTKAFLVRCVLGRRDIGWRNVVGRARRAAKSGGRAALFGAPVQPSLPTKVHPRRHELSPATASKLGGWGLEMPDSMECRQQTMETRSL